MRGHCNARGQIGTGPVRAALAGPMWAGVDVVSLVSWRPVVIHSKDSGRILLSYELTYPPQLFFSDTVYQHKRSI